MSLSSTLKKIFITTKKIPIVSRARITEDIPALLISRTDSSPPPRAFPLKNPLFSFLPVTENPRNIVNLISSALKEFKSKDGPFALPSDLTNIVPWINSNHVSQILLRFQSHPSSALSLFNWVKSDLMFDPSIENYCHVILILTWSRNVTAAMNLLEEMILLNTETKSWKHESGSEDLFLKFVKCSEACNLDPVVFDLLMKAHLKAGMIKASCQIFHKVINAGYAVSIVSCNFLLDGLQKLNLISDCWKVFKMMRRVEILSNTFTFNIMVNVLCKEGNMDAVFEFVEKMEEDGFEADLVTYNTIISCFCRRKMLNEALNLFKIMSVRSIPPDSVTCTALIYGYCVQERTKEAHQLLVQMIDQGISPNSLMYSTLIFGYCKEGKMVDAKSMLYGMMDRGIRPDDFTYRVIIEGYRKQGKLHKGWSLVSEFEKLDISMPWEVYDQLISRLCDEGRVTAAVSLRSRASSQFGYMPGMEVYAKLIESLCEKSMVVEALRLKVELDDRGMKQSVTVYESLVCCLSKMGKMSLVGWLVEEMLMLKLTPDAHTCRGIIKGYCDVGDIGEAVTAMELFAIEFRILDNGCYAYVTKKICEGGDVDKFLEVQNRMRKVGFAPNRVDCTLMLQSMWEKSKVKTMIR